MSQQIRDSALPPIPVFEVGADWPMETLEIEPRRIHALLDEATVGFPRAALRLADGVSRRWLARWESPYLAEIDRVAGCLGRPGAHYFNISYEWGCSTSLGPSPDGRSARLMRVLDWPSRGLGRHVVAARVDGAAGPWITLTWPGYTGVLQAMAPGRFAAALNQAPMAKPLGLLPVDWAMNRVKVWQSPHLTPAHLLRRVFETAAGYADARRLLSETPLAIATIYSLTGVAPDEACVIERMPEESHVIEGPASAANDWQAPSWRGRSRGQLSDRRAAWMAAQSRAFDPAFAWLRPPVLNETTRLALVADAAEGRLLARGFETNGPATEALSLRV